MINFNFSSSIQLQKQMDDHKHYRNTNSKFHNADQTQQIRLYDPKNTEPYVG